MTRRKTSDAVEILDNLVAGDPVMQNMIAEKYINRSVASQIYTLRTQHNLTQKQLAERVGTTQSVIARLEDADYEGHSLTMLSRVAGALECSVSVTFVPNKRTRPATKNRGPTSHKMMKRTKTRKVA